MEEKRKIRRYGREFTERIFELKEEKSHREIAAIMGVEKVVIDKAVERENKLRRMRAAGELPKPKGVKQRKPATRLEELEKRNKELEMENELLKKYREELRRW